MTTSDPSQKRIGSGGFSSSAGPTFGPLVQVLDDVWWAWGTTRFMPGMLFSRNMFVLRERDELVIVHAVMLPEEEQKKLEALGTVKHIVKLGAFHGMDDAKYVARYRAKVWAPKGVEHAPGLQSDVELCPGSELPFQGAKLLEFETSRSPEMVMWLPRHGGTLLACDSVQSWQTMPAGVSFIGSIVAKLMGYSGRACIGPAWRKQCEPKDGVGFASTFRTILDLEFRHALGAHGPPILNTARDDLRATVDRIYR